MAYSIASTASNMKSPYKSPIVTSDNYQVTLKVMRKKAVHVIKTMFKLSTSILTQCTALNCLVNDMLLQSNHAIVSRRFRSATSSMGLQYRHASAWCTRQLASGRDYSVATGLGQLSAVSCLFDAVLYAIKTVAGFYKVQSEHIKLNVMCCVNVFVSNSLGNVSTKNWQNWMTFD